MAEANPRAGWLSTTLRVRRGRSGKPSLKPGGAEPSKRPTARRVLALLMVMGALLAVASLARASLGGARAPLPSSGEGRVDLEADGSPVFLRGGWWWSGGPPRGGNPVTEGLGFLAADLKKHPELAGECGPEAKERLREEVAGGGLPAVMRWDCAIEPCGGGFVEWYVKSLRARNRTDITELTPCEFIRRFENRTIWFVGDSQQQYFYRATKCFLSGFMKRAGDEGDGGNGGPLVWRGPDGGWLGGAAGDGAPDAALSSPEPLSPEGAAEGAAAARALSEAAAEINPFEDYNVTNSEAEKAELDRVIIKPDEYCCGVAIPFCTSFYGNVRLCLARINKSKQLVDDFLPNLAMLNATSRDVMTLNNGLWVQQQWDNYPHWVRLIAGLATRADDPAMPTVVWRETNSQHFAVETGEYPDKDKAKEVLGEGQKKCGPIPNVTMHPDGTLHGKNHDVVEGGWRNKVANPILEEAGVPIMHIWNETVPMWGSHVVGECTHFCQPGAYPSWIGMLHKTVGDIGVASDLGNAERPLPHLPAAKSSVEADQASVSNKLKNKGGKKKTKKGARWRKAAEGSQ